MNIDEEDDDDDEDAENEEEDDDGDGEVGLKYLANDNIDVSYKVELKSGVLQTYTL